MMSDHVVDPAYLPFTIDQLRKHFLPTDIDALIVLDRVDRYAAEVDRTSDLASKLSLKHGLNLSRTLVSQRGARQP